MPEKAGKQNKERIYRNRIAFRSISGIVLLMILCAAVIGYIGYRKFANLIMEQYADDALLTANTAANIVDGEDLYRYSQSDGDTGDYWKAYNELQRLCNSTDSTFIYVIQPDTTDYGHIRFIFSIGNYNYHYKVYDFGYYRETTNDEYREKYRSLYEQRTFSEIVVRNTGDIETDTHITAMIPLRGADNKVKGILCVQRQLDVLDAARFDYIRTVTAILILIAVLVAFGQTMYLHRTLIEPLMLITDEAHRFAVENVKNDTRLTDAVTSNDEIGKLAGSIDLMEKRIDEYIEDIKTITAERERISAELSLASRIQADILPKDFSVYPGSNEFSIYASMTPAKEVGGDFYDFFMIDDDHLCMVVADVSGKGIPAALFMMQSKALIKFRATTGCGPARVLETVNNQICSDNREEMFVTVWIGFLDLKTGIITASNAGHEYPLLMTPGSKFKVLEDKHGFVLGGLPDMQYEEYEIKMEKGSKIFVYTDGLPEAQNNDNEFLGMDRIVGLINQHPEYRPHELIEEMRRAVSEFADGAPIFDDLTMLCIEYDGK